MYTNRKPSADETELIFRQKENSYADQEEIQSPDETAIHIRMKREFIIIRKEYAYPYGRGRNIF